jgi:glutamate-ammonia-ligase adenylyltransferase
MSMEAAERYYESLGRTWERAAYIKARPAAGDIAAGERFLATLRPSSGASTSISRRSGCP